MKQYRHALFIGRFQPFHLGHLYSLKKCLAIADKIVIAVGSSQERGTENNPWDYTQRKQMIEAVLDSLQLRERVARICESPDDPSDAVWLAKLKEQAGDFDVVVSNNPWVLEVLKADGYPTVESGLFNREEWEGVKIRALLRVRNSAWKARVPAVVVPLIT
jgi:nicotinamide-nucleotide adenylyltransferase